MIVPICSLIIHPYSMVSDYLESASTVLPFLLYNFVFTISFSNFHFPFLEKSLRLTFRGNILPESFYSLFPVPSILFLLDRYFRKDNFSRPLLTVKSVVILAWIVFPYISSITRCSRCTCTLCNVKCLLFATFVRMH